MIESLNGTVGKELSGLNRVDDRKLQHQVGSTVYGSFCPYPFIGNGSFSSLRKIAGLDDDDKIRSYQLF